MMHLCFQLFKLCFFLKKDLYILSSFITSTGHVGAACNAVLFGPKILQPTVLKLQRISDMGPRIDAA